MRNRFPVAGASLGALSLASLCVLASLHSPAVSQEETAHDEATHDHSKHSESSTRNASGAKKTANELWLDQLWKAADTAYHKGDYPLAVQKFKAIVVLDPTETEAFSTGAWLMWSLGNGDEATAFVRRGIALNSSDGDAWETAADHFDLRKVFAQETLDDYQRALALAPAGKDTRLLRHRVAIAAQIAGRLDVATQVWTEIVKDYPSDVIAQNKLQRLKDGNPLPAPRIDSATSSTRSSVEPSQNA